MALTELTTARPARERVRRYALDGAELWFRPSTGLHVRLQSAATAHLRRRAPRVVMFGITNACNLRCDFCSRDTRRASEWTVASAAGVLRDLGAAGALEVAFGGGEPLLFPGFPELVRELRATTALALHLTSNGTRLPSALPAMRGALDEVRLSVYDDQRWRDAARALDEHQQRWGANLLVDRHRLPRLRALLAELVTLGCRDVAILPYLGVAERALDDAARDELAAVLADAPLPCRISVCFGTSLAVPHLPASLDASAGGGGDCGAGLDFVTLTPDRRLQACSFWDRALPAPPAPPVETAEDVLALWRAHRDDLARPAPRSGCARQSPGSSAERWPQVAVWHGYSGNNSGECVLVGKFETADAARQYVAELTPGLLPDEPYSQAWRELFEREGVAPELGVMPVFEDSRAPEHLLAVGSSVIAVSYGADDAFPELRALTWKRAGYVVDGGIHLHGAPPLLVAVRGHSPADAERLVAELRAVVGPPADEPRGPRASAGSSLASTVAWDVLRHGPNALALARPTDVRVDTGRWLRHLAEHVQAVSGDRPLAAEPLLLGEHPADLTAAVQRLAAPLHRQPRLWVSFWGRSADADAARFAASLAQPDARAHRHVVLLDGVARRKRLAVLGLRHGGAVSALDGAEVELRAAYWHLPPPPQRGVRAVTRQVDAARIERSLQATMGAEARLDDGARRPAEVVVTALTRDPRRALDALVLAADEQDCRVNIYASEPEPVRHALARVLAEVDGAR